MLATLPWYDLEEVRGATDAFWAALAWRLAEAGVPGVPAALDRETPHAVQWRSPGLLFSQACGYDALIAYRSSLRVVATPRYTAPGCQGSLHRSFIVVRDDARHGSLRDLQGFRCAVNTPTSHSGMNALRALAAPLSARGRFFGEVMLSGSHVASLALVASGRADVAAIDCVTYALVARHRPEALKGTRVLCDTPPVPAPPYVTGTGVSPECLGLVRRALVEALADPRLRPALEALLLDGADLLTLETYGCLAEMERAARGHGYDEIQSDPLPDDPAAPAARVVWPPALAPEPPPRPAPA